jgi:DNA modification methylase
MSHQAIQIDPEFRSLIPPLSAEERAGLEEAIAREGCRDPLVVWNGVLIDGHNRHEICTRRGIPFQTVERQFDGRDDVKIWIIDNQLHRRNLPTFARAELALVQEPLIAAKAKAKQLDEGKRLGGTLNQKSDKGAFNTNKQVAKAASVSHDTIHKVKKIAAKAPEPVKEKLRKGEITINQAFVAIKSEERKERRMAELKAKPTSEPKSTWRIIHGDVVKSLESLPQNSARLIFADPPYNIGFDYGDGEKADRLDDADYMKWVQAWVGECMRVLTKDGSLWLMINDEYVAEYAMVLKKIGLDIRNWIIWHETFGVNCTNKFNRCHRHILYATKDDKRFVFNADEPLIRRQSDRQALYDDPRANPDGKLLDDVWLVPRLTGTAAERIPEFPTQLPIEIPRRIVAAASMPGDTVVDPFNGSGTTGAACIELGRNYIGIEKQKKFVELATLRLKAA